MNSSASTTSSLDATQVAALERELQELRQTHARLQAENADLQQSLHTLGRTLDHSPMAIVFLSPDHHIRSWNEGASLLFGWTADEVVGQSLAAALGEQPEEFGYLLERAQRGLEVRHQRSQVRRRQGSLADVTVSIVPLAAGHELAHESVVYLEDFTERTLALEKLRRSEQRYRKLMNEMNDIVYERDLEGRFTSLNPAITRIMGWLPEEVLGQTFLTFVHPEDAPRALADLQKFMADEAANNTPTVYRVRHQDGSYRYLELTGTLRRRQGEIVGVQGTARDVTERIEAMENARRSEQRYRELLANIQDLVFEVDLHGMVKSVNPALLRCLGWRPEEIIGNPLFEELRSRDETKVSHWHAANRGWDEERPTLMRAKHRDGSWRLFEVLASPRREQGRVVSMQGVARDVTERLEVQRKLHENERFVTQLANASPNLLYVYDLEEERNVFVNSALHGLLGYWPEQLAKPGFLLERFHPEDRRPTISPASRTIEEGEVVEREARIQHADGRWRWFYLREVVFRRMDDGRPKQVLGVAIDVTERKQVETELVGKQRLLERIAEVLPVHVYIQDLRRNRVTFSSPFLQRMLGYTTEEVFRFEADDLRRWVHPQDRDQVAEHLARRATMTVDDLLVFEARLRHKHGDYRWIRSREVVYERDADGAVSQMLGVSVDITGEKQALQELEDQTRFLEDLANVMPVTLLLADLKADLITYVSPHIESLLGYQPAEIQGRKVSAMLKEFLGNEADRVIAARLRHFATSPRIPHVFQYQTFNKAGELRWLETHEVAVDFDSEGNPLRLLSATIDIDEQKRADDLIAASKARYQQLVETLDGIVWEAELPTLAFTFVSPQAEKLLGYPEAAWREEGFFTRLFHPEERDRMMQFFKSEVAGKAEHQLAYRVLSASGETRWFQDSVTVIREEGIPTRLRGIMVDITARKLAEEALAESEERLRRLIEDADDLFILYDLDGRIRYFKAPSYLDVAEPELIGKEPAQFLPEALAERVREQNNRVLTTRQPENFENPFILGTETLWFNDHVYPVFSPEGALTGVGRICRNITQQKRAEQAQEELRQILERMAYLSPCIHYVLDVVERRYVFMGRSFERLLGYSVEEVLTEGELFFERIMHPDDWRELQRLQPSWNSVPDDEVLEAEFRYRHASGQYRWLRVQTVVFARAEDGTVRQRMGVAMDVTAERGAEEFRRSMESRLQQSQKLESLGILAGGIAHDFNNLLTAIMGNASLIQMHLPRSSPAEELVGEIELASRRAAELTQQMMAYAGKGRLVFQRLHLNEIAEEISKLLRKVIAPNAQLVLNLAKTLPAIEGDGTQLRQVLMNLLKNASEALAGKPGNVLVRTAEVDLGEADLAVSLLPEAAKPGQHVLLEVRDNGVGMPAATLERIFDPFFTTKFTGRGLGLSAVLGIVRSHRGTLRVDSAVGEGTRFQLFFPAVKDLEAVQPAQPRKENTPHGRILVVEDNPSVADLTRRILLRSGYSAVVTHSGPEALEAFNARPTKFSLAIVDLALPETTGDVICRQLRALAPELPLVLMSGHFNPNTLEHLADLAELKLLSKPFTPSQLLQMIQTLTQ